MKHPQTSHLWLGLCVLVAACALAFVWVPLDTETGLIEKVRRRLVIGDGLAPTVAAVFLGIGGLLLLTFERRAPDQPIPSPQGMRFLFSVMAVLALGLLLMRWAGPVAVYLAHLLGAEPTEYRLLRDTALWKYIGYFLGGVVSVAGLIALIEDRLTLRACAIACAAVIVLIVIYDLPFDDILLPPNGDV